MSTNPRINVNPRRVDFSRINKAAVESVTTLGAVRLVKPDDMNVDHGYQRHLSPSLIKLIMKDFDPQLFGVILLSERANGTFWVLDGQQRVESFKQLGHGQRPLPCEVLTDLSWAREAEIYDKRKKNRKGQTPQEKFKGSLAWGEPTTVAIAHTVREHGFRVNLADGSLQEGQIVAVSDLTAIGKDSRRGTLSEVLILIRDTWGTELGPRGSFLRGMATFVRYYRGQFTAPRFVSAVGKQTMDHINRDAKAYRDATGAKPEYSVCMVMVRAYNDRLLKGKRLPSIEEVRALRTVRQEPQVD